MINDAIQYARTEWLMLSIYAVVLLGLAHSVLFVYGAIPAKVVPVTGLTLFLVAGTLAALQFHAVYRSAHPAV